MRTLYIILLAIPCWFLLLASVSSSTLFLPTAGIIVTQIFYVPFILISIFIMCVGLRENSDSVKAVGFLLFIISLNWPTLLNSITLKSDLPIDLVREDIKDPTYVINGISKSHVGFNYSPAYITNDNKLSGPPFAFVIQIQNVYDFKSCYLLARAEANFIFDKIVNIKANHMSCINQDDSITDIDLIAEVKGPHKAKAKTATLDGFSFPVLEFNTIRSFEVFFSGDWSFKNRGPSTPHSTNKYDNIMVSNIGFDFSLYFKMLLLCVVLFILIRNQRPIGEWVGVNTEEPIPQEIPTKQEYEPDPSHSDKPSYRKIVID